jgi:hypothetical protein
LSFPDKEGEPAQLRANRDHQITKITPLFWFYRGAKNDCSRPFYFIERRRPAVETSIITATTYFTNNIMIRRQISLARAVVLMTHARAIIPPDADLLEIRCPGRVLLVPAHIIFNVDRAFIPQIPLPSKRGIYQRDQGMCAYCGKWIPFDEASMDHIIPQSRHGATSWINLVNACKPCNERKADRTPAQARMPLLFEPSVPKARYRPDL